MGGAVVDLGDGCDVFEGTSGKVCTCKDVSMLMSRWKEKEGGRTIIWGKDFRFTPPAVRTVADSAYPFNQLLRSKKSDRVNVPWWK